MFCNIPVTTDYIRVSYKLKECQIKRWMLTDVMVQTVKLNGNKKLSHIVDLQRLSLLIAVK
jgi:hypothetical protein